MFCSLDDKNTAELSGAMFLNAVALKIFHFFALKVVGSQPCLMGSVELPSFSLGPIA